MVLRLVELFYFFQSGDRLYTSKSDVYRRQILTYKEGPRAERVNVLYQRDMTGIQVLMKLKLKLTIICIDSEIYGSFTCSDINGIGMTHVRTTFLLYIYEVLCFLNYL